MTDEFCLTIKLIIRYKTYQFIETDFQSLKTLYQKEENMKYDIGIIGGAGPIAGRLFFDYIIAWYQKELGAWQDQDFPSIVMVSYPFSDMLSVGHDKNSIKDELKQVVEAIPSKYFLIACNTLHCFADGELPANRWLHLMKLTAEALSKTESKQNPLVLCTTTSRNHRLHQEYFDCVYPNIETQPEIDYIIEKVLKGKHGVSDSQQLYKIIQEETDPSQDVVLGCTELSLLVAEYPFARKLVDPAILAAEKVCLLLNPKHLLKSIKK